ncbi:DNA-binding protein HU [bacterium K02(2017)]|nr:DNA-binding protein HU [bacterium K02(2017)]
MTKAELIEKVANDNDISKALAEKVINTVTTHVSKCLKKNDKITLTGFGTFSVSKRKARTGRNPQTGAEIKIKATRVPKFKAGKALKDLVSK